MNGCGDPPPDPGRGVSDHKTENGVNPGLPCSFTYKTMKMLKLSRPLPVAISFLVCTSAFAQDTNSELFKKFPSTSGWHYLCQDMVQTVNQLRLLGKTKALDALRAYTREEGSDPTALFCICRVLFVQTNGWEAPRLGEPCPSLYNTNDANLGIVPLDLNERITEAFPLFPIAFSHNVPFFVIEGYSRGGRIESIDKLLDECERLQMISTGLPTANYEAAARNLIRSKQFRDLYPNPLRAQKMGDMILLQAGVASNLTRHK